VIPQDVKNVAHCVLRHRIILNYEAEADKITTDKIIGHILNKIRVP
jgi:MoxR-like ATPase